MEIAVDLRGVVFERVLERFPIDRHAAQRGTAGSVFFCHGSLISGRVPRGGLPHAKTRAKCERRAVPPKGFSLPYVPTNSRLQAKDSHFRGARSARCGRFGRM